MSAAKQNDGAAVTTFPQDIDVLLGVKQRNESVNRKRKDPVSKKPCILNTTQEEYDVEEYRREVNATMSAARNLGIEVCFLGGGGIALHGQQFAEATDPSSEVRLQASVRLQRLHVAFMQAWADAVAYVIDASTEFLDYPLCADGGHYDAYGRLANQGIAPVTAMKKLFTKCVIQASAPIRAAISAVQQGVAKRSVAAGDAPASWIGAAWNETDALYLTPRLVRKLYGCGYNILLHCGFDASMRLGARRNGNLTPAVGQRGTSSDAAPQAAICTSGERRTAMVQNSRASFTPETWYEIPIDFVAATRPDEHPRTSGEEEVCDESLSDSCHHSVEVPRTMERLVCEYIPNESEQKGAEIEARLTEVQACNHSYESSAEKNNFAADHCTTSIAMGTCRHKVRIAVTLTAASMPLRSRVANDFRTRMTSASVVA